MNRKGKSSPLARQKAKNQNPNEARKASPKLNFSWFKKKKNNSAAPKKVVEAGKGNPRKNALAKLSEGIAVSQPKQVKSLPTKKAASPQANRLSKFNSDHQKKPLQRSLLLAIHLIAIAVGISTIFGTAISIASSFDTNISDKNLAATTAIKKSNSQNQAGLENLFAITSLGKEIPDLKAKLESLAAKYPNLEPEIFFVDLDNKGFVSIKGKNAIASASTIKLPVLVAFFQDLDRGKISLEEQLTMTKDIISGGSGSLQYEKPGSKFTALEIADKMMTISDNTATNMLVARMGGMEVVNQRFLDMGLTATRLHNPLPDLEGTNTTSPEDLGNLLVKIDGGELISLRSRDRLLGIMRNIVRNTLLPEGLEAGAIIAHKTGDIKSVLGDVGMIDMPSGKRYIASVLVKRPDNDPQAKEFIQEMSQVAYQHFKYQKPSFSTSR